MKTPIVAISKGLVSAENVGARHIENVAGAYSAVGVAMTLVVEPATLLWHL